MTRSDLITMTEYYYVFLLNTVHPELYGPYDTSELRDAEAKAKWLVDGRLIHRYIRLDVDEQGPHVSEFNGDELHSQRLAGGNYELSDGGCIEYPDDDGTIRRRDKYDRCEDVRRPGDSGYEEWAELFPEFAQ